MAKFHAPSELLALSTQVTTLSQQHQAPGLPTHTSTDTYLHRLTSGEIVNMCLAVNYFCFCGAVARTERVACGPALARPYPPGFHKSHKLEEISVRLPREEWDARKGACPLKACPQNDILTGDAGLVAAKCPGCSTLITQGQLTPEETAVVDDARFLDRSLWDTHHCTVEYCPFNVESMVQANEILAVKIREAIEGRWSPDDDAQILEFSSNGADDQLIAEIMDRTILDVQKRLWLLRHAKKIE